MKTNKNTAYWQKVIKQAEKDMRQVKKDVDRIYRELNEKGIENKKRRKNHD